MSNIFRTTNATPPESGVTIQSSVYGQPLPVVYGTTKVSGNLFLYGNFVAVKISSGGGGKGSMFGSGQSQYNYYAAFAFAVSEGPIVAVNQIWVGQTNYGFPVRTDQNGASGRGPAGSSWSDFFKSFPSGIAAAELGFQVFDGTYPQATWYDSVSWTVTDSNGITTTGQTTKLNYNGVAYLAVGAYNLGGSSSIPNLQYEVQGIFSNSVTGQFDADPSLVIADILTNEHYGGGFPSARMGSLAAYQSYCLATGLLVSPAYSDQRTLSDVIDELMLATNSNCFWSSGQFQVTPYGDQTITIGQITPTTFTDVFPSLGVSGFREYQVESPQFASDGGVTYYATGNPLTKIADNRFPGAGQYSLATNYGQGIYWFNPADNAGLNITANFAAVASFTPPQQPIYSLGDNDFIQNPQNNSGAGGSPTTGAPVLMTRVRKSDRINSIKIEYLDGFNNYNPAVVYAENQAEIDAFGKRTNGSKQLHLFCSTAAAGLSAQLQLRRQNISNTYKFDLDQRYILLDPMDIVAISDSALGLVNQWVRITEIDENDDGTLSFTCEEYLAGSGAAPEYSFAQQQGQTFTNINATPGPLNAPFFFEPPYSLNSALEVYCAISGATNWGGADAWVSTDGVNYQFQGRISGGARMGTLTAPLASVTEATVGQTIDQTNTLAIDLTESNGAVDTASQQQATNLASLCYADGELLAYGTATLTATSKYNLNYLVRGAYGSTIGAHASGSNFARLDNQGLLKLPFTSDRVGQTIYVKLLSFNQFGGGEVTLANAVPYTYTIQGTALALPLANVSNLAEVFVGNLAELNWTEITDFRPVLYEVRQGASWANAQTLIRQAHPPFRVMGDGTYWVSAYSQPVSGLVVYSQTPQSVQVVGSNVTDNLFATRQQDPGWAGTLSGAIEQSGATLTTEGLGGGTYQIPTNNRVTITYPTACAVIMKWTVIGQPLNNSIFIYKGLATITSGSAVVSGMKVYNGNARLQGNATLIGLGNTSGIGAGQPVSGIGISSGTEVLAVLSSASISITIAATTGSTTSPSTQAITVYPSLVPGLVIQTTSTAIIPAGVTVLSVSTSDLSSITMSTTALASSTITTVNVSINWMNTPDLFGAAAIGNITAYPMVRMSQDGGVTFSTFQRWVAGYYRGNSFDAEFFLQTGDINSVGVLDNWTFEVDVPDRVDHYTGISISSLGSTLVFRPDASISTSSPSGSSAAFNGGQNASTQVTVMSAPTSGGISVVPSNVTLGSCVLNAYSTLGTAIAASANVVVEGY